MLFIILTSRLLWYVQIAVCISIGCFRCVLKFKFTVVTIWKVNIFFNYNMRFNENISLRYLINFLILSNLISMLLLVINWTKPLTKQRLHVNPQTLCKQKNTWPYLVVVCWKIMIPYINELPLYFLIIPIIRKANLIAAATY